MSIWFKDYKLKDIKTSFNSTSHMAGILGIEISEIGNDFLKATMPVNNNTKQPMGLLHGGASCVLSESLGSMAAYLCIDPAQYDAVGIEINANHIKSATSGSVTGICKPLHIGKSTHVWQTDIFNENNDMICSSRLTVAIKQKAHKKLNP